MRFGRRAISLVSVVTLFGGLLAVAAATRPASADLPGDPGAFTQAGRAAGPITRAPAGARPQAAAAADADSVIGPDDRVRITDTTAYPWRAIAFLEIYDEAEQYVASCTATFIGARVLLTAAHCLYEPGVGFYSGIVVIPGKDGGTEPFGFQLAEEWRVPNGWINNASPEFDYGLILLPDATLGNAVGWLRIASLQTATLTRSTLTPAIVGYPGDKLPEDTMWGATKPAFTGVTANELFHDVDTFSGESGSAIFSAEVNGPNLGDVVGIHTLGSTSGNAGRRMTASLISSLNQACTDMGCSITSYVEPGSGPTPTATATPTRTPTAPATATGTVQPPLRVGINIFAGPLGGNVAPAEFLGCLPPASWSAVYAWNETTKTWHRYLNPAGGVPAYVNAASSGAATELRQFQVIALVMVQEAPAIYRDVAGGGCAARR